MSGAIRMLLLALLFTLIANCGSAADEHERDGEHGAKDVALEHAGSDHDDDHDDEHDDDEHAHEEAPAQTRIAAATAKRMGILVQVVTAGSIRDEHEVQGLLTPIEGLQAQVVARFPGPIHAVYAGVGDAVRKGQNLAEVESNISLSRYALTAPISGTIIARSARVGDLAADQSLFEIVDLTSLWVDLHLFGADAQHITTGLGVEVERLSDGKTIRTELDRVLPITATASQSTIARATLRNEDGNWRPGTAVLARVTVDEVQVPLRIPLSALQRLDGQDVVFRANGDTYQAQPVQLGRRDAVHVAVRSGLSDGDVIVVAQSYVIKADIEKSSASHDH